MAVAAPSFQQLNIHDPRRYFQNMGDAVAGGGSGAAAARPAGAASAHDAAEALQRAAMRPGQPLQLRTAPALLEQVGGGWLGARGVLCRSA